MAAGDLITGDWQAEYNGVLLGDGTPFHIAQIDGLLDLPDIRSSDTVRMRRHGLRAGDDYTAGRRVVLTLEVSSTDTVSFSAAVDQLMVATTPGGEPAPLVFQIPGVAGSGKRSVMCRPRRRSLPVGREFYYQLPLATIEFYSVDPRIESSALLAQSTDLETAGGGLNFNAVAPFVFGATAEGGVMTISNDGNFTASPTFTFTGPVSNPRVENLTHGQTLSFTITVADGDTLVVDTDQRTVLLNGTASRYSTMDFGSNWVNFQPGVNEITYRASTTTTTTMTTTWRSAWV